MKMFIYAAAFIVAFPLMASAGEEKSVLVQTPAPASAPATVVTECHNGRCCTGNRCFIVREPRFEKNVSTTTTCDACGVKETSRTVTRTRRFR